MANVIQVKDDDIRAAYRRHMQDLTRCVGHRLAAHVSVAGAKVDQLVRYEFLAFTGTDLPIIELHRGVEFAEGCKPLLLKRERKGRSRAIEDYLCSKAAGAKKLQAKKNGSSDPV